MSHAKKLGLRSLISSKYFSFGVTIFLFALLYLVGILSYHGFSKPQVFLNLFIDNAALIIATVGITFVLLIGGIDISIGSVIALTCMMTAQLLRDTALPAGFVIALVLAMGVTFGFVQGFLITRFNMQPFIVTMAGQFFARGLTAILSRETIDIANPFYKAVAGARIHVIGKSFISVGAVIALVALVAGTIVMRSTRFGRNMYALGGSEQSSVLMGLPTKRTKISAYMVCGFCSALAGVVYSFIMLSGYPLHAIGIEMDAIAASVIGGTLLTGGVAFLPGTLFGVLIQGIIQTFIAFQGTLSPWWTRIFIASLLCLFIVMQTLLTKSKRKAGYGS
jgi:galactofuranose transport system permease protein